MQAVDEKTCDGRDWQESLPGSWVGGLQKLHTGDILVPSRKVCHLASSLQLKKLQA